jgi:hypothetical protein
VAAVVYQASVWIAAVDESRETRLCRSSYAHIRAELDRIHGPIAPNTCPDCGAVGVSPAGLAIHMARVHRD